VIFEGLQQQGGPEKALCPIETTRTADCLAEDGWREGSHRGWLKN
tara:strand:+ start:222 stop:356 length:135 start_codon:yes stop_codon:yes gene_type:complete